MSCERCTRGLYGQPGHSGLMHSYSFMYIILQNVSHIKPQYLWSLVALANSAPDVLTSS